MLSDGIASVSNGNWLESTARNIVLGWLNKLTYGQLTLQERGVTVEVYGDRHSHVNATIDVLDNSFYRRFLLGGSTAAGETYSEGLWLSPDLKQVVVLFVGNMNTLDEVDNRFNLLLKPWITWSRFLRRNTVKQAKQNILAHYDLGDDLYRHFLDEQMIYSSAIFPHEEATLTQAQICKLRAICEKLKLTDSDHLLEIGTGWGGLAIFAATEYGCKVTTTTISETQYAHTKQRIEALGLENQITLLKNDYRELTGEYDKLVSIEMIEAVGQRYLTTFFEKCSSLLASDGLMLLQSILINDQTLEQYSKQKDFIQEYIFPGGFLPSMLLIQQHVKARTDFVLRDAHDIGLHYAKTLDLWHQKLLENRRALNGLGYEDEFLRMWEYYLCYCFGGFLERHISASQLLFSKLGHKNEIARH